MKKHLLAFVAAFMLISTSLFAQPSEKYQDVDEPEFGIFYSMPESWRYDPYSTSSVCDCPGVILDNFDNKLRINIYPTSAEGMAEQKRNEVWDYVWDPASGKPYDYKSKSKTKYQAQIGAWKVKQENHVVIRINARTDKQYARIFIFGPADDMKAQEAAIHHFLDTFRFTKLKRKYRVKKSRK